MAVNHSGSCYRCGRPARPGSGRCEVCLKRHRDAQRDRETERRRRRQCPRCGLPALPGLMMCRWHREQFANYYRDYNRARRAAVK